MMTWRQQLGHILTGPVTVRAHPNRSSNSQGTSQQVQPQLGHTPSGTATVRAHPNRSSNNQGTSQQVQPQLGHIPTGTTATLCNWSEVCHFCCFFNGKNGIEYLEVKRDETLIDEIVSKRKLFFLNFILPELLAKRYSSVKNVPASRDLNQCALPFHSANLNQYIC